MKAIKKRTILIIASVCIPLLFIVSVSYPKFSVFVKKRNSLRALEEIITEKYPHKSGYFSIFVQDLSYPSLSLTVQSEDKFAAASLMKLPILAAALIAINEEKIDLDDTIKITKSDITGGSGIIKGMKLPVYITFMKLLELMISRSDNTATNKVIDLLGFDYINGKNSELGLKDTVLKRKMMDFQSRERGIENYTTTSDIAYLLEKIYKKELVARELSSMVLSFLKEQKVNDRLPRYLPSEAIVAHKTGLERGIVHDAGIVFAPKGNYIICVLTRKVKDYNEAKKFIADVSLLTYNLYE